MGADILAFGRKSYAAEIFTLVASGLEFKMSGTLDGMVDFCIIQPNGKSLTYSIESAEARLLAAKLNAVAADIHAHCLFDADPLLMTKET